MINLSLRRFGFSGLVGLGLLGMQAKAECVLETPTFSLPHYDVLQDSLGTLAFRVGCSDENLSYGVQIHIAGGNLVGQDFQGRLLNPNNEALNFRIQDVGSLDGRPRFSGSKDFSYTVLLPANQWSLNASAYTGTLVMSLTFN